MSRIMKQFGTPYSEINLTEHEDGLRYWVELTLYNDQSDSSRVLWMTDDLTPAEDVYYQAVERFARY